jgi:hypothetical protein
MNAAQWVALGMAAYAALGGFVWTLCLMRADADRIAEANPPAGRAS